MTLGVAWVAYGTLDQPTGGYVYDRLIVEQLRAHGATVEVCPLIPGDQLRLAATVARLTEGDLNVVVGDALCVDELGPLFEALAGSVRRVLLVHHLTSWEHAVGATHLPLLSAQERRAVSGADLVVTTSYTTANRLTSEYPECVPYTIAPGADRLGCLPHVYHPTHLRLLGIGSFIARKRWDLLLAVLDELSAPEIHLRLIGDITREPSYSRSLAAQIASSSYLTTHVKCLGVVPDEQLAHEFAAADALVLPSSLEGYGMVLTEALHAGVPVIASCASAIPEVLTSCGAALLFDEASELFKLLKRLVREPPLRDALEHAAAGCQATLPTWSSAGARFRELLNSSVNSH